MAISGDNSHFLTFHRLLWWMFRVYLGHSTNLTQSERQIFFLLHLPPEQSKSCLKAPNKIFRRYYSCFKIKFCFQSARPSSVIQQPQMKWCHWWDMNWKTFAEMQYSRFSLTLIQKWLLQPILYCSPFTLMLNWMPLIQYEQREGPSWCGSSNAPSSGSHIDRFFCEGSTWAQHELPWKTTQHKCKATPIGNCCIIFLQTSHGRPAPEWLTCSCHANCKPNRSVKRVEQLNRSPPGGCLHSSDDLCAYDMFNLLLWHLQLSEMPLGRKMNYKSESLSHLQPVRWRADGVVFVFHQRMFGLAAAFHRYSGECVQAGTGEGEGIVILLSEPTDPWFLSRLWLGCSSCRSSLGKGAKCFSIITSSAPSQDTLPTLQAPAPSPPHAVLLRAAVGKQRRMRVLLTFSETASEHIWSGASTGRLGQPERSWRCAAHRKVLNSLIIERMHQTFFAITWTFFTAEKELRQESHACKLKVCSVKATGVTQVTSWGVLWLQSCPKITSFGWLLRGSLKWNSEFQNKSVSRKIWKQV